MTVPVKRYEPDLLPDAYGPPNVIMGLVTLFAWLGHVDHALELRQLTTGADIRGGLRAWPSLVGRLRRRPGPYSDFIAEIDAEKAMNAIKKLLGSEKPLRLREKSSDNSTHQKLTLPSRNVSLAKVNKKKTA